MADSKNFGSARGDQSVAEIFRQVNGSDALLARRYEELSLRSGTDLVFTDVQGRGWGSSPSTSTASLTELISSIGSVGQLEPVLVEETRGDGGARLLKLVSGERRLRAMKWGAKHDPGNPKFDHLAAVIVTGPLNEELRRTWQLVENLARRKLQPGELAAALLYERSAVLAVKLFEHDVSIPRDVVRLDDPVARFEALNALRLSSGLQRVGAPWRDVIRRLGMEMSASTAKSVARAFRTLPAHVSSEMDEAEVALASRLQYAKLHQGSEAAAAGIWALVKGSEQTQLLTGAVNEALRDESATPASAVERAAAIHEGANQARSAAMTSGAGEIDSTGEFVAEAVFQRFRDSCSLLVGEVLGGRSLTPFQAGSLHLLSQELADLGSATATKAQQEGNVG